jgi:transposase
VTRRRRNLPPSSDRADERVENIVHHTSHQVSSLPGEQAQDNGRKRHVAVDTGGLLLAVVVTTASLQDRDGAFRITAALREAFSTITLVWADAGYTGRFVRDARKIWDLAVAIVKRPDQAKGFVLLHRRWVVERSFAWLTKFRRLVRDYETLPATHEAMIWTAATWQLSNRLTR